jgi:pimeloyl-ACP methyl ester carboxylesterase
MDRSVSIEIGDIALEGDLHLPEQARGLVLFAHGSGSSRHSPRNRYVASVLNQSGLATLLIDLLTLDEERLDAITGELRFDIGFLARRLLDVSDWLTQSGVLARDLRLGLFGSSTGAAAALVAAAELGSLVSAVVSRGGRPDLATDALPAVSAPTLLIVGARDFEVLQLNREALVGLDCAKRLEIVPGATHLFQEPGALEQVAELARDWFLEYLAAEEVTLPGGEPARPA